MPIPLIVILDFVLLQQRSDGSWSVDGRLPNSGACYRSLEYAARVGLGGKDARLEKGLDFLETSLEEGGLRSPGPLPGMPPEVGTTARCLHVFSLLRPDSPAVREMQSWLYARLFVSGELACWHTDCAIDDPDRGITGATSLALFALLRCGNPDRETLGRVVRWLLRVQNPDGGWPDKPRSPSSIDNTYNVLRALIEARNLGIAIEGLNEALKKTEQFVHLPVHLDNASPSGLAMTLRARLLFAQSAFDRPVVESLDALERYKERWYTPAAHYYNAILICGLAVAEWLDKAREEGNPYERTRVSRGQRFLLDFPVDIPPFCPGHRGGLYERMLGALAARLRETDPSLVTVASFHGPFLRDFAFACPGVLTSLMLGTVLDPDDMIELARGYRTRGVHPCWEARDPRPHRLLTQTAAARIRAAGLRLTLWHEERPEELGALLRLAPDALCTNDPGLLKRLRDAPIPMRR